MIRIRFSQAGKQYVYSFAYKGFDFFAYIESLPAYDPLQEIAQDSQIQLSQNHTKAKPLEEVKILDNDLIELCYPCVVDIQEMRRRKVQSVS